MLFAHGPVLSIIYHKYTKTVLLILRGPCIQPTQKIRKAEVRRCRPSDLAAGAGRAHPGSSEPFGLGSAFDPNRV